MAIKVIVELQARPGGRAALKGWLENLVADQGTIQHGFLGSRAPHQLQTTPWQKQTDRRPSGVLPRMSPQSAQTDRPSGRDDIGGPSIAPSGSTDAPTGRLLRRQRAGSLGRSGWTPIGYRGCGGVAVVRLTRDTMAAEVPGVRPRRPGPSALRAMWTR